MSQEKTSKPRGRYFSPEAFRAEFPIFERNGIGDLAYLDNAATTQKPQAVLEAEHYFYTHQNANIHRGVYRLSMEATAAYDRAREAAARFIGAAQAGEVVFVRGATEGINLVARSFVQPRLAAEDEILLTLSEHHANFVPWQMVAEETGARLRVIPLLEDQTLDLDTACEAMTERTKILALVHASNSTGAVFPARELIDSAHERGIPVLVDACQSAAHGMADVGKLDCDFLVFSGHKVFGPTGIGVLYGKHKHLEGMRPYQGGGDMIERVRLEGTTFAPPPQRFEAGTPNIAGAVGLAAALEFSRSWSRIEVEEHEARLLRRALEGMEGLEGVRVLGGGSPRLPLVSFTVEGVHSHDIATFFDTEDVAVRAGHHCCQPLMQSLEISGTTRASFSPYNTEAEVDRFVAALKKTLTFFGT